MSSQLDTQRHIRPLLANLPDAVVVECDRDLVCRFAAGGGFAKAGLDPDDLVGRPLAEIFEPYGERRAELLAHHAAALHGREARVTLHSAISGDDYELAILPLVGDDGSPAGTMAVATNVTGTLAGRREAERLARILTASGEALVSIGLDERIDAVNSRACELFGYREEEMVGMDPGQLLPADQHHLREAAREAVVAGRPWRGESESLRRDGSRFWAAVTISPIFDEHGRLAGRSGLFRDITEAKAAERRLREANRRFQQTFEHAPIGMALVGVDGLFLEVNSALCDIAGYDRQALLAKTFQDITHPDDLDADLSLLQEVLLGTRTSYEMEKRYVRADGSIVWILLTVSLVRDEEGCPVHFISQVLDIDDRKAAETQLRVEADLDSLTGALTRRRFTEVLTAALASARRHREKAALLFVDLDRFKPINDRLGHQVGDELLRAVSAAVASRLRATDAFGRHGGDEFVILLDRVSGAQGRIVADELERTIAAIAMGPERIGVTASIGVAELDGVGLATAEEALAAADEAMYERKRAAR